MTAGAQVNGKMIYQSEPPRRLAAPHSELIDAVPAEA